MRHGAASRRMRNNNGGGNNGGNNRNHQNNRRGFQNKNRVFDSNGPDVRIRGTAFQIVEKYATLAKDANASGDRVLAESYLQHAEHYQRLIGSWGDEGFETSSSDNSEANNPYDRFAIPQPAGVEPQPSTVVEEDLSLPASILGAPKVAKEELV